MPIPRCLVQPGAWVLRFLILILILISLEQPCS
jgi:hypothetical protein